ncbi:MAG: YceI family protein, partial [Kofleriaceae bacterium]
ALALVAAAFAIRAGERRRATPARSARVIAWIVAVAVLGVAIVSFASGGRPPGARDVLPATAAVLVDTGFAGSLDAHAGTYTVVAHAGTAITAHLKAGGETFDARFDHDITGEWQGDPHDPSQPMHARVRAAAAAVDTGVRARTKHAREKYLRTDEYPALELSIDRVLATRSDRPDVLAFRAAATVHLMDRSHPVEVAGTLERPDAAARARLGLAGDVLVVQADFALPIAATALAPKAGDFDGDRIPIHASLVLRRDRD